MAAALNQLNQSGLMALIAFNMNWTAMAASNRPMIRVPMRRAMGFSHFVPWAATRKIQ